MLSIHEIRKNCFDSTYHRGRDYFLREMVEELSVDTFALGRTHYTKISATVSGSSESFYEVRIDLDEHDRIDEIDCTCAAATTYWGMCKHCVAVALAYREQEQRQEQIPTLNRGHIHVQNTSQSLKSLMDQYAVARKQDPLHDVTGTVKLQCAFSYNFGKLMMECKIGIGKMYVVKNLVKLVSDVRNENHVVYGVGLKFTHRLSAFTESSRQLYQLIERTVLNMVPDCDNADYHSGNNYRYIPLFRENLEDILLFFREQTVPFDSGNIFIREGNPPVTLQLTQQQGGALVNITDYTMLQGRNRSFLLDADTIWCCLPEFSRAITPLLRLNQGSSFWQRPAGIYLSQKDYTAFCRDLLPVVQPFVTLETGTLDLEEYAPVAPEFSLYLRMPDRDTLEITGSVRYKLQSYDLLANHAPDSARNQEEENALRDLISRYFQPTSSRTSTAATALAPLSLKNGPQERETAQFRTDQTCWVAQEDEAIYELLFEGLELLSQQADVYVDDSIRRFMRGSTPTVSVGIGYNGNLLDLNVQVGGMDPEELQSVLSSYRLKKKYYRLKTGDFISTELEGLKTLSELSDGLQLNREELVSGKIQRDGYRALYLDNVLSQSRDTAIRKNQAFRQLVDDIQDFSAGDTPLPQNLNATLRNYQQEGYQWLSTLYRYGFGGILADDMGLGKTLQVIALMLKQAQQQPDFSALVVCPASLVYNWENELTRFAPTLTHQIIAGTKSVRCQQISHSSEYHVNITSYDLLKRNIDDYQGHSFHLCVLDEAQYIKNAGTQVAKAVKALETSHRLALTGTPIENRLSDLWSIFDFLMPGYLYSYQKFKSELESPIIKSEDENATKRLSRMVSPFLLRRRKGDVLKDLPDKLEENIVIPMAPEQQKLYTAHLQRIRNDCQNKNDQELKSSRMQILAEITRLRQLCCTPELCYENYSGGSGKVDAILELLENAVDAGHNVLVFSQFTAMLELLIQKWGDRPHLYLSGKDSKRHRQDMVDQFQSGQIPVFFISLKAGGTGLNLTEADTVIHCDPWWNVAAQNQATDRAHRIGQKNVVNVLKIVAKDSIEERILTLQEKKASLSDAVIEGEAASDFHLDRETLNELFRV